MSHTIYAAKFEQTIIHQHVNLRRESQSHTPTHVLMRLYLIDKSLIFHKAKEEHHVRTCYNYNLHNALRFTVTDEKKFGIMNLLNVLPCFKKIPKTMNIEIILYF